MTRALRVLALPLALAAVFVLPGRADAAPSVVDPDLAVRTAVSGLDQPISIAFIGDNDMLVLEKATGKVKRVVNGTVQSTVLDLAVNSGSERGLLGIALHPHFWVNGRVYLFWTETISGQDTIVLSDTPLLGNRVDEFYWNGSTLTLERNIIRLRAVQQDAGQPERGNHDGGVLRFGPDKKLYIIMGDTGRRGQLQNLVNGPFGPGIPDDQFGGPGARRRASHRAHPPAERRRHGSAEQSVLPSRRRRWAERSVPTSRSSSPTGFATASGWRSTRSPATCGSRRTATTASPSSTAPSRGSTRAGCRSWARRSGSSSSRRSRRR